MCQLVKNVHRNHLVCFCHCCCLFVCLFFWYTEFDELKIGFGAENVFEIKMAITLHVSAHCIFTKLSSLSEFCLGLIREIISICSSESILMLSYSWIQIYNTRVYACVRACVRTCVCDVYDCVGGKGSFEYISRHALK